MLLALAGYAGAKRAQVRAEAERLQQAAAHVAALTAGPQAALSSLAFFETALADSPDNLAYYPGFFLAADAANGWEAARTAFAAMPKGGDERQWRLAAAQFHVLDAGRRLREAGLAFEAGEGDESLESHRLFLESAEQAEALDPATAKALAEPALAEGRAAAARILAQPAAYARYAEARFAWLRQTDAKKAASLLRGVVEERPSFVDARLLLAEIMLQEERHKEAVEQAWAAETALAGEPFLLRPWSSALGTALALNAAAKHRSAARLLREREKRSQERGARLAAEAQETLERALAADPQNSRAEALRLEMLKKPAKRR